MLCSLTLLLQFGSSQELLLWLPSGHKWSQILLVSLCTSMASEMLEGFSQCFCCILRCWTSLHAYPRKTCLPMLLSFPQCYICYSVFIRLLVGGGGLSSCLGPLLVLGRPCVPGFLPMFLALLPMIAQCCLWLWWFSVWKRVFILSLSGQGLPIVLGQDLGPGSKVNSLILPKQHEVFTCAWEPWMCCLFTQLLFTEDQSLGRILCLSHRQLPPFLHATMEGLSPVSCPLV